MTSRLNNNKKKRPSIHAPHMADKFKSFRPNDVILWPRMTSCHDVTWRPDITPWAKALYRAIQIRTKLGRNAWKSQFLTRWPWPLTLIIKLDLHVKFLVRTSNGSIVRGHTHTQTHRNTPWGARGFGGAKGAFIPTEWYRSVPCQADTHKHDWFYYLDCCWGR